MLVRDRERKAVRAVAGAELALEVGGPEIVGRSRHEAHGARVRRRPPPAPPVHQPVPCQEIRRRARRGPVAHPRVLARQDRQQLACAPERVRDARRDEELRHRGADLMRASVRRVASIHQPASAIGFVPGEPHIADASANSVPGAQRRHRPPPAQCVADKPLSLFHRHTLLPWHRHPR